MDMSWIHLIVGIALLETLYFSWLAGSARGKYGVDAPATTGHEMFERHFRVHQNHLEQLIVFFPALYLSANYASTTLAVVLGAIFVVARPVYAAAYVKDPGSRTIGFVSGYLATVVLLLSGIGGIVMSLL